MTFKIAFDVEPWFTDFRELVRGTPSGTAARALMSLATVTELRSPRAAVAAIPRWKAAWLAESLDRRSTTASSYGSRLRIALGEFLEDP